MVGHKNKLILFFVVGLRFFTDGPSVKMRLLQVSGPPVKIKILTQVVPYVCPPVKIVFAGGALRRPPAK